MLSPMRTILTKRKWVAVFVIALLILSSTTQNAFAADPLVIAESAITGAALTASLCVGGFYLGFLTAGATLIPCGVAILASAIIGGGSAAITNKSMGGGALIAGTWATALSVINGVLYLIFHIAGMLLTLAGLMVDSILRPQSIITANIVQVGWGITRDFANMFFILILLGIALDFILFSSFKVKQMLPRLLIIALLVNFSLPLAGILIDFANIFAHGFINQIGGVGGITATINNTLRLTDIFNISTVGLMETVSLIEQTTVQLLFSIAFQLGTALVYFAMALMLIVRTGYLYILLILLPLVLVLHAFPPTSEHWNKWLSSFIKWTMFLPIMTFFLYLSFVFLKEGSENARIMIQQGQPIGFFEMMYRYVITWIFMLGSLMAAQQMGIHTGNFAMKVFSATGGWAKGKLSRAGKGMATATGRKLGVDKQMEGLASGLQKIPGLGGILASGVRGLAAKTKAGMAKQEAPTAAEKAKWEGLSDGALREEMETWEHSVLPGSNVKAQKIYETLVKRGKHITRDAQGAVETEKVNAAAEKFYAIAKKHGDKDAMKAIRKSNPIAYQKIADNEWKEERGKGNIVNVDSGRKDKEGRPIFHDINKNTGKTLGDTQNRAFEEMTSADFENLKGTWTPETVENFVRSGVMSQGHLRMANNNLDHDFIDLVGDALQKRNANGAYENVELLKEKSQSFFNFLKSGGGKDGFGVKLPDEYMDEEKKGKEKQERQAGFGQPR